MAAGGDAELSTLIECLQFTLKPEKDKRLEGERYLKQMERQPYYGLRLAQIVDMIGPNLQSVRLAAAVALKNYIKKFWPSKDSTEDFEVPVADREPLKLALVPLMYRCPPVIQKVIGETINLIAWVEFPAQWPQLLTDLTSKFPSGETEAILGSLRTSHGLFKHYRGAFESQGLWSEIKFVLDQFAIPFTTLFLNTLNRIPELERLTVESQDRARAKEEFQNAFQILLLCCKIYYSLIYQELPQVFVDHLGGWMEKFLYLLNYDNIDLRSDNDEEPGVLNSIKSQICAILTLFAFKYDDDFEPYVAKFVEAVWKLLLGITQLMQDDLLAFNAMEFLSKALAQNKCKTLFNREGVLESICEKIIVPNIQFRQSDEEIFSDNPDEFIRRDIEGSDIDTRRRAAADLIRAATKHFEEQVTRVLMSYIQYLITEFQKDQQRNWKMKDSAIFLTSSLAAKGQVYRFGATSINPLMDVVGFARAHVIPHLENQALDQAVLKADCLKFIVTFRAQLPRDLVIASFPNIIRQLDATNTVVHTYAAHCLERIFSTRDMNTGTFVVQPTDIQPFLSQLLSGLLKLRKLSAGDKENPDGVLEENEYTMKCIMRTLSYLQERMIPCITDVVAGLLNRLRFAIKNPGNPRYDHYLFESLSLCIGIACKANPLAVTLFENALFPQIEVILKDNVDTFFPYVFQLLGQMLEYHTDGIPQSYVTLLDYLLNPLLLDHDGCISSVVRLLGAFFDVGAVQVSDRLTTVLGVFHRLVISKKFDHEGFNLLRCVVDKVPLDKLAPFLPQIFRILFERLTKAKTPKFIKNLNPFLFFFILRHGPDPLISVVDQIQPGIFGMLMDSIMLTEIEKVSRMVTRRLCFVGGTLLLTESTQLLGGNYDRLWIPLLDKLVRLVELPPEKEAQEDLHLFDLAGDETAPAQANMQNQLVFAKKAERDPTADRGDVKQFLAKQLGKQSAAHAGQVVAKIRSSVPDVQNCINAYCQAAGVVLS